MERREDLASILPYLPVILRTSHLFWPPETLQSIKKLSLGPDVSRLDSGELLFDAILDLRETLGISNRNLAFNAGRGYVLFFDKLMDGTDARSWFGEVVPRLARMLMRLPAMLEEHYGKVDDGFGGRHAGLRILRQQECGIVLVSQELCGTLLACSLFCLFPSSGRSEIHLPTINFDHLFSGILSDRKRSQQEKIRCLIHYFERITSETPIGYISYERKVLPQECGTSFMSYPEVEFWEKSLVPLSKFKVFSSGLIEDQEYEALEVDFANEFLGGGALHRGCVQEEIRFMISPELIVGMLFLPSMNFNESIEIIGAERFSNYTGYASSFLFVGDFRDKKPVDSFGRKQTRIIAIDALYCPGMKQYGVEYLLRETNKAFSGFYSQYQNDIESNFHHCSAQAEITKTKETENLIDGPSRVSSASCSPKDVGVATGNWGCGAFGGDPELKCLIQWLAASQASRPFLHYYTFGLESLQRLKQVTEWILQHKWTVGELWSILVEYSSSRFNGQTSSGFLNWLLPLTEDEMFTLDADYMSD